MYAPFGSDLNGKADGDAFGASVSISANGTAFVVGAPSNDGNGNPNSGHVRLYHLDSTMNQYIPVGSDVNGAASFDNFGATVRMSADGTTVVIGAPYHDGNGSDSGQIRILKYLSAMKQYVAVGVDINGAAANDNFGASIGISGNGTTIVVGAPDHNGNGTYSGQVRAYQFNTLMNQYIPVGSNALYGQAEYERFGTSLRLSADGTTLVVGAPYSAVYGDATGQIRVYQWNSSLQNYVLIESDMVGNAEFDFFGYSVGISANGAVIVVGAPFSSDNGMINSGYVRVYKFSSNMKKYVPVGSDITGTADFDVFGSSVEVSADGSIVVVGAKAYDSVNRSYTGHVRVYQLNATINSYTQVGFDINGEGLRNDYFGWSIGLSSDGTTLAVGALGNMGRVRLFRNTTPIAIPNPAPTSIPNTIPVPTIVTSPTMNPSIQISCGIFGLNWFCPRRGKCGLFRRLFRIHQCQ